MTGKPPPRAISKGRKKKNSAKHTQHLLLISDYYFYSKDKNTEKTQSTLAFTNYHLKPRQSTAHFANFAPILDRLDNPIPTDKSIFPVPRGSLVAANLPSSLHLRPRPHLHQITIPIPILAAASSWVKHFLSQSSRRLVCCPAPVFLTSRRYRHALPLVDVAKLESRYPDPTRRRPFPHTTTYTQLRLSTTSARPTVTISPV